eukprot:Phypoly_transcript_13946.p1 GENE.Phypoly_transcript_13946~~Phypoly_transcript_13946.p1  ORF type:complete len:335 (+),score=36.15 Phypoly_transcript_13946:133-1005(+)
MDIDLGDAFVLRQFKIFNRVDCCQERSYNFWVLLKNSPFVDTWPVSTDPRNRAKITALAANGLQEGFYAVESSGNPASWTFNFPDYVARYVRVIMWDSVTPNYLNLAEVQAFRPSASLGNLVITDFKIVDNGGAPMTTVPYGWNAVPCAGSCSGVNWDLNTGATGHYIYMWYQIKPFSEASSYISDIQVVISGGSTNCPAGYVSPPSSPNTPQDLNAGAHGDYIYLCVQRSSSTAANSQYVTAVRLADGHNYPLSDPFFVSSGDLNSGASGDYIYLQWALDWISPPIYPL